MITVAAQMLKLRQVRTVMLDLIKLMIMVMKVAVVAMRGEEIVVVVLMVVAMTERLGSRQLSSVMWKMFPTAILRTKSLSAGSQPVPRAAPWPRAELNTQVLEICHGDICSVRSHWRQWGRPYIRLLWGPLGTGFCARPEESEFRPTPVSGKRDILQHFLSNLIHP